MPDDALEHKAPPVAPPGYEFTLLQHDGRTDFVLKRVKSHKRRHLKKPLPEWVSWEKINAIYDGWDIKFRYSEQMKYFFVLSYLLGSRVSETLQIRRGDCQVQSKDGMEFLIITVITKKTSDDKSIRRVPIPLHGFESEFVMAFLKFLQNFGTSERLFNFNRFWAYYGMKKVDFGAMTLTKSGERIRTMSWFGHPHYLRHVRATHMKEHYDYDDDEQMLFFGWSDKRMPARYSHLQPNALFKKYKEKVKE